MDQKTNKSTITVISIVVAAVVIVGMIFGVKALKNMQEQKAAEAIKSEFTELIDANIAEYLNRSEADLSYEQREFQIEDVDYEISDIYKEKDNDQYIISVSVNVKSNYASLDDTDRSLIAHDVRNAIFRLNKKDGFSGRFKIAGYTCCYRPSGNFTSNGDGFVVRDEQITVYINSTLGSAPEETVVDISKDEDAVKCESCGNKYKKGSDNAKSITRTNMCKSCYSSYKTMSDALNEMPME